MMIVTNEHLQVLRQLVQTIFESRYTKLPQCLYEIVYN